MSDNDAMLITATLIDDTESNTTAVAAERMSMKIVQLTRVIISLNERLEDLSDAAAGEHARIFAAVEKERVSILSDAAARLQERDVAAKESIAVLNANVVDHTNAMDAARARAERAESYAGTIVDRQAAADVLRESMALDLEDERVAAVLSTAAHSAQIVAMVDAHNTALREARADGATALTQLREAYNSDKVHAAEERTAAFEIMHAEATSAASAAAQAIDDARTETRDTISGAREAEARTLIAISEQCAAVAAEASAAEASNAAAKAAAVLLASAYQAVRSIEEKPLVAEARIAARDSEILHGQVALSCAKSEEACLLKRLSMAEEQLFCVNKLQDNRAAESACGITAKMAINQQRIIELEASLEVAERDLACCRAEDMMRLTMHENTTLNSLEVSAPDIILHQHCEINGESAVNHEQRGAAAQSHACEAFRQITLSRQSSMPDFCVSRAEHKVMMEAEKFAVFSGDSKSPLNTFAASEQTEVMSQLNGLRTTMLPETCCSTTEHQTYQERVVSITTCNVVYSELVAHLVSELVTAQESAACTVSPLIVQDATCIVHRKFSSSDYHLWCVISYVSVPTSAVCRRYFSYGTCSDGHQKQRCRSN